MRELILKKGGAGLAWLSNRGLVVVGSTLPIKVKPQTIPKILYDTAIRASLVGKLRIGCKVTTGNIRQMLGLIPLPSYISGTSGGRRAALWSGAECKPSDMAAGDMVSLVTWEYPADAGESHSRCCGIIHEHAGSRSTWLQRARGLPEHSRHFRCGGPAGWRPGPMEFELLLVWFCLSWQAGGPEETQGAVTFVQEDFQYN